MQKNYNAKRKLNRLKTSLLLLMMVCLALPAKAQVNTGDNYQVYMKEGYSVVASNATNVKFYDDHGPSQSSNQYVNYWDRWYDTDKHYTYVFRPKTAGDKIKVTFKKFHAYEWSDTETNHCHDIGQFSLRINDDILRVYNSDGAVADNLVAELTGTIVDEFTFMTDGAMTFEFISNEQYREEGWEAEVTAVSSLSVQAPIISRATCSNDIIITPTVPGATLYYTAESNLTPANPTPATGTPYTAPFEWPVGYSYNVKAIAVLNGVSSSVITKSFVDPTDRLPDITPLVPTIEPVEGTNTVRITCPAVPTGMNETFYVAYTTDNTEPSYNNGNKVFFVPGSSYNYPESLGVTVHTNTYEFEITTPNTKVRAKTFAYSCSDLVSNEGAPLTITKIYVDAPTLSFTTTNTSTGAGTCTISNIMAGATVYYTTNGSTPTTSSTPYNGTPFAVTPGQTVKAIAHIAGEGYLDSPVVSDTYIPGGQGSSGVYSNGLIVIDDREPHTWSYYTEESPIHSLNPRDIKITYYGNSPAGRTTMTNADENGDTPTSFSATATGVAVNKGEAGDQFIYMKTLEAANADGSGNYPYTAIPNPFQVRPKAADATGTITYTTYDKVTSAPSDWSGDYLLVYQSGGYAFDGTYDSYGWGNSTSVSISNNSISNPGNAVVLSLVKTGDYYFIKNGNNNIGYTNSGLVESTATSNAYQWTVTINNGYTRIRNRGDNSYYFYYSTRYDQFYVTNSTGNINVNLFKATEHTTTGTIPGWRGFYAWRIKSLSNGLTITGKSVGDIVYADEQISFVTDNSEGNEVEFEALWAQAYVTTCSTSNGLSAAIASSSLHSNVGYERNFVVVTGGTQTSDINNTSQKPVTITGLYPDGEGTVSSARYLAGGFTANENTKFENIYMQNTATPSTYYHYTYNRCYRTGNYYYTYYYYHEDTDTWTTSQSDATVYSSDWSNNFTVGNYVTLTGSTYNDYQVYAYILSKTQDTAYSHTIYDGHGNDLFFGRGVTSTSSTGYCTGWVYGYSDPSATTNDFTLRIESGRYSEVYGLYGSSGSASVTSDFTGRFVYGSDYDRANSDNSKLVITGAVQLGKNVNCSSTSAKMNILVLSGTLGSDTEDVELYAGFAGSIDGDSHAFRTLEIFGGNMLGGVAGGIEQGVDPDTQILKMRVRGGTIHRYLYGCGQYSPAYGSRKTIITGGTFDAWIAGGCYGTSSSYTGATNGNAYVYFGGKTNQTNTEGIFGAGYGNYATKTGYYTIAKSYIVAADEATTAGSVFGGGNNGYNTSDAYVYVLGGGKNTLTIAGNVYGGANKARSEATTTVTMKNGKVTGSLYGGANESGAVAGLATVNVSGGTVTNVFGGGLGSSTSMAAGTKVNVSGGTINNNVYGGGQEGTVTSGGTLVNVSGGTVSGSVYGAGMGTTNSTAQISGQTEVNITGGTIAKSVYGGGEAGNVVNGTNLASKVTIDGASVNINENVFGGGQEGFTTGKVVVNLFHGNIKGHLFGGALGKQGSVYVGGQKTVNITGGHVFGNVYCGSRNANDANALTGYNEDEQATTCEINMSAGKIDQNLYGAGYFGHTYGSVNVYLGAEAISSAPNHTTIDGNINYTREGGLNIEGTVYAGSDWGDFTGDFGSSTVSGMSNIYVDGTGYNSTSTSTGAANYMKAGVSILGCGTSNDAGTTSRTLIVRNYGTAVADAGNTANPFSTASRQLYSIQRFKEVIFDNAHLLFTGQGKVNSLNVTEKYGLYEDWTVYLSNGSTMITNVPCSQIKSFQSVTCLDVYSTDEDGVWNASFTPVAINGLGETGSATDNKIRVNGGSYIEVKYEGTGITKPYGELKGWAHMMSSINDQEATCAYARPKQSQETGNKIPAGEDNPNDGGFVSYDGIYNTYTAAGALVSTGNSEQIRYENHTPNMTKGDSQYFRIWRYGGNRSNMELVFDAHATGSAGYRTVDVTVTLPPFRSDKHYYRFETTGEAPNRNTTTEYGSDVLTFNMAAYNTTLDSDGVHGTPTSTGYMYYQNGQQTGQTAAACPGKTDIDDNPDVNFGLVIMPNTAMVTGTNHIICDASDNYLAELVKPFQCGDNTHAPEFTFRLTYSNELSSNMTWDPMKVKLVQCHYPQKTNDQGVLLYYDENGNETTEVTDDPVLLPEAITDYVTLDLVVVTSTTIAQNFTTQVYAIMDGQGHLKDTYISKIILPTYDVQNPGENSTFTVKSVTFTPDEYVDENGTAITPPSGSNVTNIATSNNTFDRNSFGLTIAAGDTYDNTNVWYSTGDGQIDVAVNPVNKKIGQESGRIEVGIDVVLFYSGLMTVSNETHMGTVNVEVEFDNYKEGDSNHKGTLHLIVEIYRLGAGENFYVDGVNGKDETGYGKNPDKSAATVNYIFNRCGYRPGGNIFVVNTVTVDKPETWNGARFNSVNIYRYPGMHKLSDGTVTGPDPENPVANDAFTGKLVDVTNELTLRGIVMDGMYAEATAASHANTQNIYPSEQGCNFNGQSVAPMINVAEGGRVNLKDGVVLQNNYNTTATVTTTSNPGGALSVQYGGTARMNEDAQITGNINGLGGGAWVDGSLIVSDHIMINGNMLNTAATSRQSNVWLTEATDDQAKANVHYKVIQIGTASTTDEYGPIEADVKIGVDKEDWSNTIDGFMPVVYAEDGTQLGTSEDYLEETYQANQANAGQGIIFHDQAKYKLEKYTDDHYLYWISTWVQAQNQQPTASEEDGGVAWDGIGNITTANQFAWLISLINGENGCTADDFAGKTIVVNADLDLKASIWVPITNFKGTLQGNGHVIQGLNSPLMKDNMGMFGNTDGATITDVIAKVDFSCDAENIGTLIGTMENTTLSNVEAAGKLEGKSHTKNMGGLVGKVESGTIHSSFSVNDMIANSGTTVMGGLIGTNGSDLYNSFANTTITGATNGNNKIGGLVGVNDGHVENCYAVVGSQTFPAFANTNNGSITICYADTPNDYVSASGDDATLDNHGTYGEVEEDIKAIGYMYGDNLIAANTNTYVGGEGVTSYLNNHTPVWNGLLSALNQWVRGHQGYTPWNRPITTTLNGDLPILAFPKDNCLGNLTSEDGKMLRYSAYNLNPDTEAGETFNNGLDNLLGTVYKDQAANIYLYNSASNVVNGTGSNKLFIHEDAALLQNSSETINATVGVTFDNSKKTAVDFFGTATGYDWHLLSSPLTAAPMGTTYSNDQVPYGLELEGNITKLEGNYLPDGLLDQEDVTWDLYTYYEPQYHWINFKRSSNSHWHYDENNGQHDPITYSNETTFTQGKGYMMAISQDSYLNSTGTLTNGPVTIGLTAGAPVDDPAPGFFTYDKGSNLVGNPYHAYLDLSKVSKPVAQGGTGFTTFYIYDAEGGIYVPFKVGMSSNPVAASQYIHPHQGFFVVKTADPETEDFTITYDMATATKDDGSYYRGDERVNYPLVNLFAENARGNRDLTIIEFNRPEIGGARKIDNLRNANFKVAAHLEGESYGVLFAPEGTERVPVRFTTSENGTFTLTWSTFNGDFSSLLLVDNMTGTITDMLRADHYTFDASVEDYASRFYITYCVTGVDEHNEGDGSFAYYDGSEWIVEGEGTLDVVDVLGRTLYSERLVGERSRVSLNGVSAGVYLLRVSDGKNTMVQKIVVR